MLTAYDIIRLLDLEPLPVEGGYFRQTWRAAEDLERPALPSRYSGARPFGTAIYYLLHDGNFSTMHRLLTDEVYHFYLGDPVEMLLLHESGASEIVNLGYDLEAGQRPQFTVSQGVWQGLRVKPGGSLALLGTTMAPGFDQADFELGSREELLKRYPERSDLIIGLTHPSER